MMGVIENAEKIEAFNRQIEKAVAELYARAKAKADAIGAYRKKRATVLIQLRNGVEFDLGGEKIKDPPATLCNDIARGICYQEKINEELATAQYKNLIVGIEALEAELNGIQSINRHLA